MKDKIQQRYWKTFFVIWRAKKQTNNQKWRNRKQNITCYHLFFLIIIFLSLLLECLVSFRIKTLFLWTRLIFSISCLIEDVSKAVVCLLPNSCRSITCRCCLQVVKTLIWRNKSNQLFIHVIPVVWDCPVFFWPLSSRLWLTNVQSVSSVSMSALA